MDDLLRKLGLLSRLLRFAAAAVLFAMMLLTTADVAGRYLFNAPIMGTFEITEFMMVCVVFFALAYTQSQKGHVAVDIVVNLFPEKIGRLIDLLNFLVSFLVFSLITWMSVERGFEVLANKDCSGTLSIPVYPFVFIVALGSAAMCIELAIDTFKKVKEFAAS